MSAGRTLAAWLAPRVERVPEAFRGYVTLSDRDDGGASAAERVERLTEEARTALGRARGRDPSDRAGAFDLLAADAWATWAADAALETDDPVATLVELTRRLADPAR